MKKLSFIIIGLFCLFSCKKTEQAYCWKCNTYKTVSGSLDLANPEKTTQCEMTQSQIDKFISDNTIKVTTGATTKTTKLTNCSKQ